MRAHAARRLAIAAAAVLVVLAAAVAFAWHVLDPGPLRRFVVTSVNVDATRPFWQIAVESDGTYSYDTTAFRRRGRIAFGPYAQRLRSIAELRWLPPPSGGRPGLTFWTVGTRRTVSPFVAGTGTDHPALRAFATKLHDDVLADVRRIDAPRSTALNGLTNLRSVEMQAGGSMCGRCLWTMTIAASGIADVRTNQPFGTPNPQRHAASVRWPRVVAAFQRARLGDLDARIPTSTIDTAGVSFRFFFPHATYTIDAPDYAKWPRRLRRSFLDVLAEAERARWSPPIDARSLPRAARLRPWAERDPISGA